MFDLLNAIADYADTEALEYSLFRDESEGGRATWIVRFMQRDADGEYSVHHTITAQDRSPSYFKRKIERQFSQARNVRARKRLGLRVISKAA